MSDRQREPWKVASLDELLGLARAMEQEAITGYIALAARMRKEGRPDLAAVFERLTAEETSHLDNVGRWQEQAGASAVQTFELAEPLFDDEGAALVAPELLDSYKAFSMAVRNEERAFVFWTYVAAHAPSDEIRTAAERMAREELGHVATLRRERRKAFHDLRRSGGKGAATDIAALELQLAERLRETAGELAGDDAARLMTLAGEAAARSNLMSSEILAGTRELESAPAGIENRLLPLCEFLLDCYLLLAEQQKQEQAQQMLQASAGALLRCIHAVRGL